MFAGMPRNTFLGRVFEQDKALFAVFLLFIAGQAFFTYKHVENTPFFHFGMYSAIHHAQPRYTVYDISVDGQKLLYLNFPDYQREMVYNSIAVYDGLQQMHFYDSLEKVIDHRFSGKGAAMLKKLLLNNAAMDTPYQKWLFRYMADMRLVRTPVLEVSRRQVAYRPDGSLVADTSVIRLFKLKDD